MFGRGKRHRRLPLQRRHRMDNAGHHTAMSSSRERGDSRGTRGAVAGGGMEGAAATGVAGAECVRAGGGGGVARSVRVRGALQPRVRAAQGVCGSGVARCSSAEVARVRAVRVRVRAFAPKWCARKCASVSPVRRRSPASAEGRYQTRVAPAQAGVRFAAWQRVVEFRASVRGARNAASGAVVFVHWRSAANHSAGDRASDRPRSSHALSSNSGEEPSRPLVPIRVSAANAVRVSPAASAAAW